MSIKITTVSPQKLHTIWADTNKIKLIDVRTSAEYRTGHLADAKLIPLDDLSVDTLSADELYTGHEEPIYLTC